jgi:CheY-like chemotaxis protein
MVITHARLSSLRLRALIVDDAEAMRALLTRLLKRIGVSATEFDEAGPAIAAVVNTAPDFILTDLSMGPMDGLTFTRTLRGHQSQKVRETPIILITGFTELSKLEAARDAGISAILAKPVTATTLYARIEEVVTRPRQFVSGPGYVGPCRRRICNLDYAGPYRRSADPNGRAGRITDSPALPVS